MIKMNWKRSSITRYATSAQCKLINWIIEIRGACTFAAARGVHWILGATRRMVGDYAVSDAMSHLTRWTVHRWNFVRV